MYTIKNFLEERNRIVLETLSPFSNKIDLTLLRKMYQDLSIFDDSLKYNPEDSDEIFWEKAYQFSKMLLEKEKNGK